MPELLIANEFEGAPAPGTPSSYGYAENEYEGAPATFATPYGSSYDYGYVEDEFEGAPVSLEQYYQAAQGSSVMDYVTGITGTLSQLTQAVSPLVSSFLPSSVNYSSYPSTAVPSASLQLVDLQEQIKALAAQSGLVAPTVQAAQAVASQALTQAKYALVPETKWIDKLKEYWYVPVGAVVAGVIMKLLKD